MIQRVLRSPNFFLKVGLEFGDEFTYVPPHLFVCARMDVCMLNENLHYCAFIVFLV